LVNNLTEQRTKLAQEAAKCTEKKQKVSESKNTADTKKTVLVQENRSLKSQVDQLTTAVAEGRSAIDKCEFDLSVSQQNKDKLLADQVFAEGVKKALKQEQESLVAENRRINNAINTLSDRTQRIVKEAHLDEEEEVQNLHQ
jgi:chromosome segregation ATPase